LGDIGCFSFYPSKNLGALGDGGCAITNNSAFKNKMEIFRNYGSKIKNKHEQFGVNSRLDSFQARILTKKLSRLNEENEHRRKLAQIYHENLKLEWIQLPKAPENAEPVWHLFPLFVKNDTRDSLASYLNAFGVETSIHYPIPIHRSGAYATKKLVSKRAHNLSNSEQFSQCSLTLPIGAMVSECDVEKVCDLIAKFRN